MTNPLVVVMRAAEQQLVNMMVERERLSGFLSLGNEVNRAKVLDQQIGDLQASLEALHMSDATLDDLDHQHRGHHT